MALNPILLVVCICIVIGVVLHVFYLNRVIAYLVGALIRLIYWDQNASSMWISIGSIHFSVVAGRLLLKDIRYHSSNQTIKIVKGQISWRYWIRRPATEEDKDPANTRVRGERDKARSTACRVHVSFQGFECFLYNRTAAYDNIVSQMESDDLSRRQSSQKPPSTEPSRAYPPSVRPSVAAPNAVRKVLAWIKQQLPNLDIKDVLPLGIQISKGAIICGNASTPNLMVVDFQRVDGTFGIVQSRSKHDFYKQNLNLRFQHAIIRYVQNDKYIRPMVVNGVIVKDMVNKSHKYGRSNPLGYSAFAKLWRRLAAYRFVLSNERSHEPPAEDDVSEVLHNLGKEDTTAVDNLEYAIERKILETPELELSYYVDVAGTVPLQPMAVDNEIIDIGNGDVSPEWGIDLVIHGGTLRYGPWADRQRAELQRTFFPLSYQDFEIPPLLQPGDTRVWTSLQVFVELRDETELIIPFREASKNWQWDGVMDAPPLKKRRPGILHVAVGDMSSISYLMPMVASSTGFEPRLEVHLDSVTITTNLSEMRVVNAESCRIRGELPAPLKWNDARKWTFGISLRQPILHLLRDHINMFTDLGKDWASGPPSDFRKFIPMVYCVEFEMHYYQVNLYANDHNIIDKPLVKEENAILTLRGSLLKTDALIPSNKFRPEATDIKFTVDVPNVTLNLSLPRWSTHALHAPRDGNNIGAAETFRIDGSYRYFAEVRKDNVEQLKLTFITRGVSYKALGWSVRYFMVMRDNYFGSFTHCTTLSDYVARRDGNLATGDPITKKYREGSANMLQVEIGLSLIGGVMVMPAALTGYETSDSSGARIGSCVVLRLPELQLQLRLHDFYMEMSLNIDTISGHVDTSCPEQVRYDDPQFSLPPNTFLIDGIDITANRLFGPQPRTATYVCIWDIHLGCIKAIVSPIEGRIIMAAGDAFGTNFSDTANAPAASYLPSLDPDVSFIKFSLQGLDVTWRGGNTAVVVSLPAGLKVDHNDLTEQLHRKVTSVRLPHASLKVLLLPHSNSNSWTEAAEVINDAYLDIYSSPEGWQDASIEQMDFVDQQDLPTGRVKRMFHALHETTSINAGRAMHQNGVYIPQPTLSAKPDTDSSSSENISLAPGDFERHSSVSDSTDSEGDEHITAADRDARIVNARSSTPRPMRKLTHEELTDEDLTSGEESDDDDLTSNFSDSDWDDFPPAEQSARSQFSRLSRITRRYHARALSKPHLWEGSPFALNRDPRHNLHRKVHAHAINEASLRLDGVPVPDNTSDTTVFRFRCRKSVTVDITPLLLPALSNIAAEMQYHVLGPELSLDALMTSYASQLSDSDCQKNTIVDIDIPSVELHTLQQISLQIDEHNTFLAESDAIASIYISLGRSRILFYTTSIDGRPSDFGFTSILTSAFLSLSKFPEYPRLPSQAIDAKYAITISFTDLEVSKQKGNLGIALDKLSTWIYPSGPEYLAAVAATLLDTAGAVREIMVAWSAQTSSRLQNIFYDALQLSKNTPTIDPFSTIQPSILVQIDKPNDLRTDSALKLLFHLRESFWRVNSVDREQFRSGTRQTHPETDVISLFHSLLARLALDADISDSAIDIAVRSVFPSFAEHSFALAIPFASLTVEIGRVSIRLKDASGNIAAETTVSALSLTARTCSSSVVQSPSPSRTSLTEHSTEVQRWMASAYVGDIDLSVLPGAMNFAQDILRVRRQYGVSPSPKHAKVSPADPDSRSHSLEITVTFQLIRLAAAAEKLIFEIGSSRAQMTATVLHTRNHRLELALNYSLIFQEFFLRALSTDDISRRNANDVLASFVFSGGKASSVVRNEISSTPAFRVVFGLEGMQLSVPRSALRLYRFVEQWRSDFFPGIEATLQDLLAEIGQTPVSPVSKTRSVSMSKYSPFQIHLHIISLGISLQVMHGTWLSWEVSNSIAYLKSSGSASTALTFGLQIASQIFRVSSRPLMHEDPERTQVKLRLPKISMTGDFDGSAVNALALVEEFKLIVKPSDWDTLLAVQQKFGHDFNDLVSLFEETRAKRTVSSSQRKKAPASNHSLKHSIFFKMKGFQIGLQGLTSTVYLQCQDIGGGISNNTHVVWHMQLSALDLSLVPRVLLEHGTDEFDETRRSAFVTIDLCVKASTRVAADSVTREKLLRFAITKFNAVMQPSSIGQLGDFIDEMQAEMLQRKEQRAFELSAFRDKTKSVLKTFETRIPEKPQDAESWLSQYVLDLRIENIGVAFPLIMDQAVEVPPTGSLDSTSVRAFLFSIKSLSFGTQRGETGQAVMKGFSFQFVSRFRPLVPSDFLGDTHVTRNRLLYPEMQAHVNSETGGSSHQVRIGANVTGFILDMDPSLSDWVFSLIDVARQGKERVERLTANLPPPSSSQDSVGSANKDPSILPTLNITGSLTFLSGKVRIHSGSSNLSKSMPQYESYDEQSLDDGEDVLSLPVVSLWAEYRATPTSHPLTDDSTAEPSILMFKSTIHSSQNILRPTLLPFITELVGRIEARMRRATPENQHLVLPPIPHTNSSRHLQERRTTSTPMHISFSLRIDQSKLELTCQPDVNVIAGLHWDSGGFIVNITPKQLVFSGTVGGLTMSLKHGFLSDQDCARLDARNLNFNVTFSKKEVAQRGSVSYVSVVLDTEFAGVVRFSRLQDMLCFKAVWLDRIPLFAEHDVTNIPVTPKTPPTAVRSTTPESLGRRQDFTTTILVRIRQIQVDVDLGQSISSMTLDLKNSVLRTKITESFHEVFVSVANVAIIAKGNLSGNLNVPNCVFQTIRRREDVWVGDLSKSKMLELSLTSGALTVSLESDHQPLLQYRAEPLDVQITDDWSTVSPNSSATDRPLKLSFTVIGTEITVVATVGTIPKIMSYINKFKVNLAIQQDGASRESSAFRVTRTPKPDNPLSAVANAMLHSAQDRFKEVEGLTHIIRQHMSLRLDLLRLVIFPRTMRDGEIAEFIGRKVHARLDRVVHSEALPAKRDLHLSFSYMAISKLTQLDHATANSGPASRDAWLALLLKPASIATIVGLPSMNMRMQSEEITENVGEDKSQSQRVLQYDFNSQFVQQDGDDDFDDIYITLNVSLYSWLTVLRKNLTREMAQVRGTSVDWRPSGSGSTMVSPSTTVTSATNSSITRRKGAIPEPIYISDHLRSAGIQRSPQLHASWSPRSPSMEQSQSASAAYPSPFRENSLLSPLMTGQTRGGGDNSPASMLSPPVSPLMINMPSGGTNVKNAAKPASTILPPPALIYRPRKRHIQRLTMRQLGEATPDLMHPFFMKKAGFNLEDALPQYVNEYATNTLEEIMAVMLKLYSKQLLRSGSDSTGS